MQIRTGKVRIRAMAVIATVAALLFGMGLTGTAYAADEPNMGADDGYVMIGDTKVSKEIGISTEEELNEFRLSSIPKTFIIDPETGKDVIVKLGVDDPDMYISAEQAKRVMGGSLTLEETLDEGENAAKVRQEKASRAVNPVTLYQRNGITTTFKESGAHYGSWPNSTRWNTGGWYASADYTYRGTHSNTGVRGPSSSAEFMQGNAVTVTAMYMSR